eukprot:scaffold5068_cov153-Pinguiococcus_pyrenoidosus.AAC.1
MAQQLRNRAVWNFGKQPIGGKGQSRRAVARANLSGKERRGSLANLRGGIWGEASKRETTREGVGAG